MKGHLYRVSVEHLENANGESVGQAPLVFEVRNHDELFAIVERVKTKGLFEGDEAIAFAIGLKLFSEVMLKHKDEALFQPLQPCFGEFMKGLKKGSDTER